MTGIYRNVEGLLAGGGGAAVPEAQFEASLQRSLSGVSFGPSSDGSDYSKLATTGLVLSIAGTGMQAIGAYYGLKQQKREARRQALAADFEASMSAIAARGAEREANAILQAGKQEMGRSALAYAQATARARTSTAARGVAVGVGSAAEVTASIRYSKTVDALTINANAVRAANAARARAQNYRTNSRMAHISAANLRDTAGTTRPGLGAISTLMGGTGNILRQIAEDRRWRRPN